MAVDRLPEVAACLAAQRPRRPVPLRVLRALVPDMSPDPGDHADAILAALVQLDTAGLITFVRRPPHLVVGVLDRDGLRNLAALSPDQAIAGAQPR